MPSRYPQPTDGYPAIHLKETDASLPSSARVQNNTRYAFHKTIARGGKCVIKSCKDLHLGRVICQKALHAEFADDPIEQKRFLREARVTAMLQHPNTVPVYELGQNSKGHYYFTMKLVVGETLREILDRLRDKESAALESWDLERLIGVLLPVAQALDYAHSHGVVHRDIKPENIVAGPFGEVLLLDWGLAKVWDEELEERRSNAEITDNEPDKTLTSQGPLQATPLYMSPEQVEDTLDIDHRTDIYSFGSVLFEVLTLKNLAWGETLHEMMENTRHGRPPTPSFVSPDRFVPSALDTLCLRCIQKEPDERIQSIREVLVDLIYWLRLRANMRPL